MRGLAPALALVLVLVLEGGKGNDQKDPPRQGQGGVPTAKLRAKYLEQPPPPLRHRAQLS